MGPIKRFNQERYETQHLNGLKAGTGFRTTVNRKGGAPSSLTRDVWNARVGMGARMYGLWHQAQRKEDCEARVWAWDGDRHCVEKTSLGGEGGGVCVCEGQGRPACCSPWACKEQDSIDRLNVQGLLTSLTGHLHHLQGKDWEFVECLCLFFSQVNRGPSGGVLNQW